MKRIPSNLYRTALGGILVYLSSIKLYWLLTSILSWISTALGINKEPFLAALHLGIGILTFAGLVALSKTIFITDDKLSRNIYWLVGLTIFLWIAMLSTNILIGKFLTGVEEKDLTIHDAHYVLSLNIESVLTVVTVIFFLWKMKKNTEANNG